MPVGEVALALGCLLGRVFGGFGGFWRVLEGFGMFGAFAGWQTVALKAHRKLCCGLGPGVPVGEVALALGWVPAGEGVWRVWRVLEGVWRVWRVLGGLEGLEGFGGFGAFLALGSLLGTVFGGFGGFWRVWRVWKVLECLERLRAGKR